MKEGAIVLAAPREIRTLAKSSLTGVWARFLLCYFIFYLITQYIPGFLGRLIPGLSYIYEFESMGVKQGLQFTILPYITILLLNGPFKFSLARLHLRQMREKTMEEKDIFSGFKFFTKTLVANLIIWFIIIIFILPFVLIGGLITVLLSSGGTIIQVVGSMLYMFSMIVGIIVAIYVMVILTMTFYILSDNHTLKAAQAVKDSIALMRKNVGRYVILKLSYLMWIILGAMVSYVFASVVMSFLPDNAAIIYIVNVVSQLPILLATIFMDRGEAFFYEFATGRLRRTEQRPLVPSFNN